MKRLEIGFGYSPLGDVGVADFPEITTGENPPAEWLDADRLAKAASALMTEFRRELLNPSSDIRNRFERPTDQGYEISFTKRNLGYYASVTQEVTLTDRLQVSRIGVSRAYETGPVKRELILVRHGRSVDEEEFGSIHWGRVWRTGKKPEIHTNTLLALAKVQAFLEELKQAS